MVLMCVLIFVAYEYVHIKRHTRNGCALICKVPGFLFILVRGISSYWQVKPLRLPTDFYSPSWHTFQPVSFSNFLKCHKGSMLASSRPNTSQLSYGLVTRYFMYWRLTRYPSVTVTPTNIRRLLVTSHVGLFNVVPTDEYIFSCSINFNLCATTPSIIQYSLYNQLSYIAICNLLILSYYHVQQRPSTRLMCVFNNTPCNLPTSSTTYHVVYQVYVY